MSMRLITPEGINIKIDPPSHRARNLWIFAAVATLALAMAGDLTMTARRDARGINRLESFRSQYAQRCEVAELADPAAPAVRDAYLHSSRLQNAVADALDQLQAGAACEDVAKRLRAADFPMAAPGVTPTIRLRPESE